MSENSAPFTLFSQENTMSYIPSPREVQAPSSVNSCSRDQYIIVNGRRIACDRGVFGHDITSAAGNPRKRRVVRIAAGQVQKIDPFHYYSPEELRDKNGRPVKIKTMPERTKGGFFDFLGNQVTATREPAPRPAAGQDLFSGRRTEFSRRLILDQIDDVTRNIFKAPSRFDNNGDWVVFPSFRLPGNWSVPVTPLMILFPTDYPALPPIGFYLPDTLPSPNGHKFARAYHSASEAPLMRGWHWYCCYVQDGAWQPAPMNARNGWRDGDNLYTYLTLVSEALASGD